MKGALGLAGAIESAVKEAADDQLLSGKMPTIAYVGMQKTKVVQAHNATMSIGGKPLNLKELSADFKPLPEPYLPHTGTLAGVKAAVELVLAKLGVETVNVQVIENSIKYGVDVVVALFKNLALDPASVAYAIESAAHDEVPAGVSVSVTLSLVESNMAKGPVPSHKVTTGTLAKNEHYAAAVAKKYPPPPATLPQKNHITPEASGVLTDKAFDAYVEKGVLPTSCPSCPAQEGELHYKGCVFSMLKTIFPKWPPYPQEPPPSGVVLDTEKMPKEKLLYLLQHFHEYVKK